MAFYFAYGSNMHRGDMRMRCPGAVPVGVATLDGWRFTILEEGYASIRRSPGHQVHGVLWQVDANGLTLLDDYEDLASGLYRRAELTVQHGNSPTPAIVYIGGRDTRGVPLPGYQERVVAAAEEWNFPEEYLRELREWLPASRG